MSGRECAVRRVGRPNIASGWPNSALARHSTACRNFNLRSGWWLAVFVSRTPDMTRYNTPDHAQTARLTGHSTKLYEALAGLAAHPDAVDHRGHEPEESTDEAGGSP